MKRLGILILLMGALIVPVSVSAQKALPQNIFCIMTVDDTIACHETEAECEIVEDQQNQMINAIEDSVSLDPNCSSFTGNIAGQVQGDFDTDNDDNDESQQDETNEQSNSNLDDGNVNIGGSQQVEESVSSEPHSSGIQPEGDVDQTFDNDQSTSSGGHIAQDDNDNEESED